MTTAYATPHVGHTATVAETGAAGTIPGLLRGAYNYLTYRRVLGELRALSSRDLADLGISRFSLKTIARNAVYGR